MLVNLIIAFYSVKQYDENVGMVLLHCFYTRTK